MNSDEAKKITLEDLGFTEFFEAGRKQLGLEGFLVARVIAEHKGSYRVKNETGEYIATITGKQVFNAKSREDYPAVGDWVAVTVLLDNERAVINAVLPRKTIIKRQQTGKNEIQIIASNIDTAFIVEAVDRDYNLNRLERYFAIASTSNIEVVIILNKIDLITKEDLENKLAEIKLRFPGVVVILTSNVSDTGLATLKEFIKKGRTYSFLGSSGVGKSSLINKLLGVNTLRTEDISLYSGRGKHITTSREMYFMPSGGIVIDNPGMREVGVTETTASIDAVFEEIIALARQCKYTDCTHTHEPGCAVLEAVNSDKIDKDKYNNYLNLKKEAEFNKLTALEKREKNKKFGKFIKKAKQDLKRYRI
ncbi:MAG: ribosome small subunit-dependent GTPase A [Candidatus Doudnabacteria bacterium]|jgi:ribosome biogenesis GTPase